MAVSAILAACSGSSAHPPARAGDLYQVDGETAYLQCQGAGSPTLVSLDGQALYDDDLGQVSAPLWGPMSKTYPVRVGSQSL